MRLRDQYFRDALLSLTGIEPPKWFVCNPSHWGPSEDMNAESMQDWASLNVKPNWACGISLLEAAKAFVDDAECNCNIMNTDHASHPATFEPDQSGEGG